MTKSTEARAAIATVCANLDREIIHPASTDSLPCNETPAILDVVMGTTFPYIHSLTNAVARLYHSGKLQYDQQFEQQLYNTVANAVTLEPSEDILNYVQRVEKAQWTFNSIPLTPSEKTRLELAFGKGPHGKPNFMSEHYLASKALQNITKIRAANSPALRAAFEKQHELMKLLSDFNVTFVLLRAALESIKATGVSLGPDRDTDHAPGAAADGATIAADQAFVAVVRGRKPDRSTHFQQSDHGHGAGDKKPAASAGHEHTMTTYAAAAQKLGDPAQRMPFIESFNARVQAAVKQPLFALDNGKVRLPLAIVPEAGTWSKLNFSLKKDDYIAFRCICDSNPGSTGMSSYGIAYHELNPAWVLVPKELSNQDSGSTRDGKQRGRSSSTSSRRRTGGGGKGGKGGKGGAQDE